VSSNLGPGNIQILGGASSQGPLQIHLACGKLAASVYSVYVSQCKEQSEQVPLGHSVQMRRDNDRKVWTTGKSVLELARAACGDRNTGLERMGCLCQRRTKASVKKRDGLVPDPSRHQVSATWTALWNQGKSRERLCAEIETKRVGEQGSQFDLRMILADTGQLRVPTKAEA